MNNKIIFRAWDKTNERLVEHENIMLLNGEFEVFISKDHSHNNCDIDQWSGMTDENGEKVFENDIIEYDDPRNDDRKIISYVTFERGLFECSVTGWGLFTMVKNAGDQQMIGVKKIGNIYENQELLEQ